MTTKSLITTLVVIILFFGLGMFVGTKMKKTSAPGNQENTYQAGWDAAKKQLEKKGIGVVPAGMEIKSLSGTIDTISGNTVTLKNVTSTNLLSDPSLDTRTVTVSGDTKFYQLTQKDSAQFQKEMEEFQNKLQEQMKNTSATPQPLTPPQPQDKKEIALADLKAGQSIEVSASENIGEKKEFTATEITVQMTPTAQDSAGQAMPVPPMPASASAPTTPMPVPPMPTTTPVPAPGNSNLTAPPAPVAPIK